MLPNTFAEGHSSQPSGYALWKKQEEAAGINESAVVIPFANGGVTKKRRVPLLLQCGHGFCKVSLQNVSLLVLDTTFPCPGAGGTMMLTPSAVDVVVLLLHRARDGGPVISWCAPRLEDGEADRGKGRRAELKCGLRLNECGVGVVRCRHHVAVKKVVISEETSVDWVLGQLESLDVPQCVVSECMYYEGLHENGRLVLSSDPWIGVAVCSIEMQRNEGQTHFGANPKNMLFANSYISESDAGVLAVLWLRCARWAGLSAEEIYRAVVKARKLPPQYASVVGVGIPRELWKMIGECLQFKAARRPTFSAMLATFLRHLQEIPRSPPASPDNDFAKCSGSNVTRTVSCVLIERSACKGCIGNDDLQYLHFLEAQNSDGQTALRQLLAPQNRVCALVKKEECCIGLLPRNMQTVLVILENGGWEKWCEYYLLLGQIQLLKIPSIELHCIQPTMANDVDLVKWQQHSTWTFWRLFLRGNGFRGLMGGALVNRVHLFSQQYVQAREICKSHSMDRDNMCNLNQAEELGSVTPGSMAWSTPDQIISVAGVELPSKSMASEPEEVELVTPFRLRRMLTVPSASGTSPLSVGSVQMVKVAELAKLVESFHQEILEGFQGFGLELLSPRWGLERLSLIPRGIITSVHADGELQGCFFRFAWVMERLKILDAAKIPEVEVLEEEQEASNWRFRVKPSACQPQRSSMGEVNHSSTGVVHVMEDEEPMVGIFASTRKAVALQGIGSGNGLDHSKLGTK
uniref:Uncharacterized protein n=1 Tax=Cannabis sativa TaxID=3483 RepID=A0A803NSW6_CANSA